MTDVPVVGDAANPGFEGVSPRPGQAIPATGAWREGDPPGHRQFAHLGPFRPERGGELDVTMAYETWGTLNADRSNAVLVLHALTGDSHIRGPAGPGHPTAGWWTALIGPGGPVDTDRFFVVAPNVLGGCQGTTGPASLAPDGEPWGARFPYLTIRDQVRAEMVLADQLGIETFALVIGGSMGGMRVLEWAVEAPHRVARIGAIATAARSTADQIAWAHAQLAAIRNDPNFLGGNYYHQPDGFGPHVGLGIARQIAHTTYRSAEELEYRFGHEAQGSEEPLGGGGRYAVQSYLEHHADKLALRFDANSYLVLTEAMLSHDVGRDRGGVAAALGQATARALVVAVSSDRLFLPAQSEEISRFMPHATPVHMVHSAYGHDGFLIEFDQLAPVIKRFVET
ncbi:MAG: homoserine O-acetyltransferase [Bifidobacteriaceae bacterium]|nr:homoserine O-acetyltransferase [Bifidobacteriaceae bacterium]